MGGYPARQGSSPAAALMMAKPTETANGNRSVDEKEEIIWPLLRKNLIGPQSPLPKILSKGARHEFGNLCFVSAMQFDA